MKKNRDYSILDEIEEGYFEVDLKGRFTLVNDVVCRILGRSEDCIIGSNYRDYTSLDTAEKLHRTFNKVFRTGGIPLRTEFDLECSGRKTASVASSIVLMTDETGRGEGFCGIVSNMTLTRDLEENLSESRERFEALFENANELIITTDEEGYIFRINKKAEMLSGCSRDELVGKSILTLAYPEDTGIFIKFWQEILEGHTPSYELRAISRTGHVEYLLASGSLIRKNGTIKEVQYNAQVITDLKLAQQTIGNLKDYLNSIIESSPMVIICLDRTGAIEMLNPSAERALGIPGCSVKGKKIAQLNKFTKNIEEVISYVHTERTPCLISEEPLLERSDRVYNVNVYPLADSPSGGIVVSATDITEKKDMELQLIHAQKMETIGQLAGGVAHDFNNLLTGMTGNLNMLRRTDDPEKRLRYMDTLDTITSRGRDLIAQMLVFTKRNEGRPGKISVRQVIGEVIEMTSKSVKKNIGVEVGHSGKDYRVIMDHTQLTQVILNLVINAMDSIEPEKIGSIRIDARRISVDVEMKRHYLLETTGPFVRIDVSDNGCGMDKNTLSKIFDPFFTTKIKGPEKGTGLGLSITYNIIKNAGGGIQVQSEIDRGTTFSILIPLVEGDSSDIETEKEESMPVTGAKGKILLVDDEAMLRDIGKEMLEFLGHEVMTAKDGKECLELLGNGHGFDLVILDMIMPGMDGYHTLMEMQRRDMDTKVLISSGFSFEHENSDVVSIPFVRGRLNKPFNLGELSGVISDIFTTG